MEMGITRSVFMDKGSEVPHLGMALGFRLGLQKSIKPLPFLGLFLISRYASGRAKEELVKPELQPPFPSWARVGVSPVLSRVCPCHQQLSPEPGTVQGHSSAPAHWSWWDLPSAMHLAMGSGELSSCPLCFQATDYLWADLNNPLEQLKTLWTFRALRRFPSWEKGLSELAFALLTPEKFPFLLVRACPFLEPLPSRWGLLVWGEKLRKVFHLFAALISPPTFDWQHGTTEYLISQNYRPQH